jgi:hypothetical protein
VTSTVADPNTYLIGINVAGFVAHRVADTAGGVPVNGWRDPSTAA